MEPLPGLSLQLLKKITRKNKIYVSNFAINIQKTFVIYSTKKLIISLVEL